MIYNINLNYNEYYKIIFYQIIKQSEERIKQLESTIFTKETLKKSKSMLKIKTNKINS